MGTLTVDKDGLKLVPASGSVIVDNELGTTYSGPVVQVDANNVVLSALTLRNGRSYGVEVASGRTGFRMAGVRVLGPGDDCVHLDGGNTGARISGSAFRGCADGIDYGDADSDNVSISASTFEFVAFAIVGAGRAPVITGNRIGPTSSGGISLRDADGGTISSNVVYQSGRFGLDVTGDDATVASNRIMNTEGPGIYCFCDAGVITGNVVTAPGGDGVDAYGTGLRIRSNSVASAGGAGVLVAEGGTSGTSDNAVITGNAIGAAGGGDGIDLYDGNQAVISANAISAGHSGIYVYGGDLPQVTLNRGAGLGSTGIHVDCFGANPPGFVTTPCSGGLVQSNRVTDGQGAAAGFEVATGLAGAATGAFTVASNIATRVGEDCFHLGGNGITATGNTGSDCGEKNVGSGFHVEGFGHTLASNRIFRAAADGYFLDLADTPPGTALQGNLSDHAGEDGFDIHGSEVSLAGNTATSSNGVGFEVNDVDGGSLAIVDVSFNGGNKASGNALGACLSLGTSRVSATDSLGTTETPLACSQAAGYIGN